MNPVWIGALGFLTLLLLIALRMPIAISLAVVGLGGYTLLNGVDGLPFVMGAVPFEAVFSYTLSVVPLFIMMGVFATHAGMNQALYRAAYAFLGHRRGGLALATITACAGFGAICGSSLATAATMSKVALPEMKRYGYDNRLATGSVAAGGTLGVLIPPSVILVIYAYLTESSVGQLFMAAILPGILAMVVQWGAVVVITKIDPQLGPPGERSSLKERLSAFLQAWHILFLFALVIGGIYIGWFSPTEAAAVGAFGVVTLVVLQKKMTWSLVKEALEETALTTTMIFMIVIGTGFFSLFLEDSGLPHVVVQWIQEQDQNRFMVLAAILLIYLVLGCFMDSLGMILITVPFFTPLVQSLEFDVIWFGIIVVLVVELGLITPPVGMNVFVIKGVAPEIPLSTLFKGVIPFVVALIVTLLLLIAFPALVLWLPSTL